MTPLDDFRTSKLRLDVLGERMAVHESGEGPPIVFLHGNPTSSLLWRDVIPHVAGMGRSIAPDLIGMGDSSKLDPRGGAAYRFVEHRRFLDALLDLLEVDRDAILVLHDWGSALGFDWARRHRDRIAGIAYTEAIVQPVASWDDWPQDAQRMFKRLRGAEGEQLVLEENVFVERILPAAVLRALTEEELDAYRQPFPTPADRWPTLQWPREIPIEGEPADVVEIVEDSGRWLAASDVPKLFINADPGSILVGAAREFCRTWPQQTEVTVPGVHFVPEDSPEAIGAALRDWIGSVRAP